jgi:transcriptional regulator with XRE-family HTH domain
MSSGGEHPDQNVEQEVSALNLGGKIRNLRQRRNLTLQGVAAITGLSKSLLSQIENEVTIPPIATLARIAKGLGVTIGYFFKEPQTNRKISFVPFQQRAQSIGLPHNRPDRQGYSYQILTHPIADQHMEPFWVEFQPRDIGDMTFFHHSGEEFLYVQEGLLEFRSGDQTITLAPGDSLYFDATIPHAARSLNQKNACALVVLFPGSND